MLLLLLLLLLYSPVEVADTVNSAVCVDREGPTLQAPSADDAAETGRVVRLPASLQHLRSVCKRTQKSLLGKSKDIVLKYYK